MLEGYSHCHCLIATPYIWLPRQVVSHGGYSQLLSMMQLPLIRGSPVFEEGFDRSVKREGLCGSGCLLVVRHQLVPCSERDERLALGDDYWMVAEPLDHLVAAAEIRGASVTIVSCRGPFRHSRTLQQRPAPRGVIACSSSQTRQHSSCS